LFLKPFTVEVLMSKTYDIPLRRLIKDIPQNFLYLVFGIEIDPKEVRFLDVKLPKLFEREADLVLEYRGEIYHLEIQTTDDPKMPLRMLHYYGLIKENYGKASHQAVVYVGEKALKRMKDGIEDQNLKFIYKLIDLNLLDCSPLLESEEPTDWVLAVLCRMEKEERFKGLLRRFKKLPEPKRERYLKLLFHIARLRPKRLKIPITIEVEKDPLYLEGLEKGVEKTKREDVINLYKELKLPPQKIAKILTLPPVASARSAIVSA
jgi:hypothetical protein